MKLIDYIPFTEWIPKDELVKGTIYFCKARNFEYGLWDEGVPFGTVKPFAISVR